MSSVSTINSNTVNTGPNDPVMPTQTLTQADFLQLLVTQMTSQDPLNPESSLDSITQMAQFSALQENQTMEGDMARINATSLIGQTVTVQDSQGNTTGGVVSGVQVNSGTPQIVINGMPYDLSDIVSVTPTPLTTPATPSSPTP